MTLGPVAQMYEQALDPPKGWFRMSALDKSRPICRDEMEDLGLNTLPAGRCVVLNAAGNFIPGGQLAQMPMFLWCGSHDADVFNDGVTPHASGVTHWIAISPAGMANALVATGKYELQTTEFDDDFEYTPNMPVGAHPWDGVICSWTVPGGADGRLPYRDWICGICSWHVNSDNQQAAPTGPVGTNAHGVETLTFWTYFLPEGTGNHAPAVAGGPPHS